MSLGTQHRYEAGALPASEYLLRIGEAGADVGYILLGRRSGDELGEDESALITALRRLMPHQRAALLSFLQSLSEGTSSATVHDDRAGFTPSNP